jgi:hypothetical protein
MTLFTPRRLLIAAAALAVAAPASASAATAPSSATCAAQTLSSPFEDWGDDNSYWLAPDGGFENGASGWNLGTGAKVVTGNENLGVLPGTKSLQLGGTGVLGLSTATTPSFCVDPTYPTFRFLVKNAAAATVMTTSINFTASNGLKLTVAAKVNVYALGSWSLAESQPLATAIPAVFLKSGTTATVTFQATAALAAEGLRIDDLMIDPYRRG